MKISNIFPKNLSKLVLKCLTGFYSVKSEEKSRAPDHIFTRKTIISKHLNTKKDNKVFSCFIDHCKVCDSINCGTLFYKLNNLGINCPYFSFLPTLPMAQSLIPEASDLQGSCFFSFCFYSAKFLVDI